MLPLDSGPNLAVGQWIVWWSDLSGGSSSRGKLCMLSYHSCHIYRTWRSIYVLGDLKLSYGGQDTKEWNHFYVGRWPLKTPCKNFNLAIGGGLVIKWLKNGEVYLSCNYSCTISFLVKVLLIKLRYHYIQYA